MHFQLLYEPQSTHLRIPIRVFNSNY